MASLRIVWDGENMKWGFRRWYRTDHREIIEEMDFSVIFRLVLDGALVGLVGGTIASTFRYCLAYFEELRMEFMGPMDSTSLLLWLFMILVMGYVVYLLLLWAPLSGGSGIPQIEGEMQGIFDMPAWRTLIAKYIGGSLTSFGGFSVGREGPSIQVAGAVGKIIARILKRPLRQERVLISAGAAAGLTAAFNAPISGAIFIFEEIHKSFYPVLVIPTFTAALVSNFVASLLFGLGPSLGFTIKHALPITYIPHLIVLGFFVGCLGVFFNKLLLWCKRWYSGMAAHPALRIMLTFVAVSGVGYFANDLLGGGNSMVGKLSYGYGSHALWFLFFLMMGKLVLTCFCYGSGVQGGIFLPILVIGAAAGSFFYHASVALGVLPNAYVGHFALCAMGGILASTIRSPLLSILLVLEMTQSFEVTYAIGIVTIVSYLTAEMLKQAPIYDSLLALMLPDEDTEDAVQTFFEASVPVVSPLAGKALKDITFPEGTMVISISRHGEDIAPMADTVLEGGDHLYISCRVDALKKSKELFQLQSTT